jgi:hypothetical protein
MVGYCRVAPLSQRLIWNRAAVCPRVRHETWVIALESRPSVLELDSGVSEGLAQDAL